MGAYSHESLDTGQGKSGLLARYMKVLKFSHTKPSLKFMSLVGRSTVNSMTNLFHVEAMQELFKYLLAQLFFSKHAYDYLVVYSNSIYDIYYSCIL